MTEQPAMSDKKVCWCWTTEHNRVAVVVRGEEIVHHRYCPNRPQGAPSLEDIYAGEDDIGSNLLHCTENSLLIDAKHIFEQMVGEDVDFNNCSASAAGWLKRFEWLMKQERRIP